MLKENQVAVSGRVNGVWNNNDRKFEVKKGVSASGNTYHIFEIGVSKKDGETWVNGKGVKVMLWGDVNIEEKAMVGLVGRFQPDNFTNKEGKEVRGVMVVAFADDMFTPEKWDNNNQQGGQAQKAAPAPAAKPAEAPAPTNDASGDDVPF